ncbi:hypothetical protein HanPI659440_Chr09g0330051 [Helianthus annuus]|nr:hypothetical protein HanPI659440_Chr09g0330051 [Helianthus annuus]
MLSTLIVKKGTQKLKKKKKKKKKKVAHLPLLPHPQTLLTKVLKQWIKVSSGPLHYHPFHHLLKPLLGHQSLQKWLAQMLHICSLHQQMPSYHTKQT